MKTSGCNVLAVDFETTGIVDPLPVSAAVVGFTLGRRGTIRPEVLLDTLVNPGIPIPSEASAIHGITDDRVADAPLWTDVAGRVADLLGTADLVVAYHLPYDLGILHAATGFRPEHLTCGLVLENVVAKYEKGKKLTDACRRRGIPLDAHNAAGDCTALAHLLPCLLGEALEGDHARREDLLTLPALTRWTLASGLARDADYAAYCKRSGKPEPTGSWARIRDLYL